MHDGASFGIPGHARGAAGDQRRQLAGEAFHDLPPFVGHTNPQHNFRATGAEALDIRTLRLNGGLPQAFQNDFAAAPCFLCQHHAR